MGRVKAGCQARFAASLRSRPSGRVRPLASSRPPWRVRGRAPAPPGCRRRRRVRSWSANAPRRPRSRPSWSVCIPRQRGPVCSHFPVPHGGTSRLHVFIILVCIQDRSGRSHTPHSPSQRVRRRAIPSTRESESTCPAQAPPPPTGPSLRLTRVSLEVVIAALPRWRLGWRLARWRLGCPWRPGGASRAAW
jgi:hypothetical protein